MTDLLFPFESAPEFGQPIEVAPSIFWMRLPLPFRLDHVNVYLLEDAEGWSVIDTGVDDPATRRIWQHVIDGRFQAKPLRRVVVTHFHPDHVGAAAFLCARTGAVLMMSETEYLTARVQTLLSDQDVRREEGFFRGHGLVGPALAAMAQRAGRYRAAVPDLPRRYDPLREGDILDLAGRDFEVRCFAGHSPAQVVLKATAGDLVFAADHVMARISPNISVSDDKPDDDPLALYLRSFEEIRATIPDDGLVLPGHRLPFRGLHLRTRQLAAHHAERCEAILAACRPKARSVADLVPLLFPVDLDAHQLWFAFSEALAHVNYLARDGRLVMVRRGEVMTWGPSQGARAAGNGLR